MRRTRHDHLHGSARVNEGPESEGAQRVVLQYILDK